MMQVTFTCGCVDQVNGAAHQRCPIHTADRLSVFVASAAAMTYAFGPTAPLPQHGLFYPKIEGMKGFS